MSSLPLTTAQAGARERPATLRWLIAIHRYAGLVLALLMLMWCLTGMVMVYVPYPSLSPSARLTGLAPVSWRQCCIMPPYRPGAAAAAFDVEMMAGIPVMHIRPADAPGRSFLIDLGNGQAVAGIAPDTAMAVARDYAQGRGLSPFKPGLEQIGRDRWTIAGVAGRGPLYRIALGDSAGTEIYVSQASGQVVQRTNARQRFWNYLGAIPHWLYIMKLRQNPRAWTEVMVWSSLAGCFLVLLGLYIGVDQLLRARRRKRWSPYRGFLAWHHLPGIVFGLFLLSWVASGWLSMNPFGLLEGGGSAGDEVTALLGPSIPAGEIAASLRALSNQLQGERIVSIQSAPLDGKLYLVATRADGRRERLDADGRKAPLTKTDLSFIASVLSGKGEAVTPQLLVHGDDYYFSHDDAFAQLPVYRVIQPGTATRYYVDAVSGNLRAKLDANARKYRWLQQGLHRLDFTAVLRSRPLWDIVMLGLLAGASLIAGTGTWLAARYLYRTAVRPIRARFKA